MADVYAEMMMNGGYMPGRTLIQGHGEIGGHRHVLVKLQMSGKDVQVFPTIGFNVKNPFKGFARAFEGTLGEYKIDGTGYILKTYAVAKATSAATDTTIYLKRSGYDMIPFVGDVLMVAPDTLDGTGTAVSVTAVEKATDTTAGDVWKVILSDALGALTTDSVLTEGSEAGDSVKPMVTNINAFFPNDYDFCFTPASGDTDFEGARYNISICLAMGQAYMYTDRMQPLSAAMKKVSTSKVDGWFLI